MAQRNQEDDESWKKRVCEVANFIKGANKAGVISDFLKDYEVNYDQRFRLLSEACPFNGCSHLLDLLRSNQLSAERTISCGFCRKVHYFSGENGKYKLDGCCDTTNRNCPAHALNSQEESNQQIMNKLASLAICIKNNNSSGITDNNNSTSVDQLDQFLSSIEIESVESYLVAIFFIKTSDPSATIQELNKSMTLKELPEKKNVFIKAKLEQNLYPIWILAQDADALFCKAKGEDCSFLDHEIFFIYIDLLDVKAPMTKIRGVKLHSTEIQANNDFYDSLTIEDSQDPGLFQNCFHLPQWPSMGSSLALSTTNMAWFRCDTTGLNTVVTSSLQSLRILISQSSSDSIPTAIEELTISQMSEYLLTAGVSRETVYILESEKIDGFSFTRMTQHDLMEGIKGIPYGSRIKLRSILEAVNRLKKVTLHIRVSCKNPFSFAPYLQKEQIKIKQILPGSWIYMIRLSASQLGCLYLRLQFGSWQEHLKNDGIQILDIFTNPQLRAYWRRSWGNYDPEQTKAIQRYLKPKSAVYSIDPYQLCTRAVQTLKSEQSANFVETLLDEIQPWRRTILQKEEAEKITEQYRKDFPEYEWNNFSKTLAKFYELVPQESRDPSTMPPSPNFTLYPTKITTVRSPSSSFSPKAPSPVAEVIPQPPPKKFQITYKLYEVCNSEFTQAYTAGEHINPFQYFDLNLGNEEASPRVYFVPCLENEQPKLDVIVEKRQRSCFLMVSNVFGKQEIGVKLPAEYLIPFSGSRSLIFGTLPAEETFINLNDWKKTPTHGIYAAALNQISVGLDPSQASNSKPKLEHKIIDYENAEIDEISLNGLLNYIRGGNTDNPSFRFGSRNFVYFPGEDQRNTYPVLNEHWRSNFSLPLKDNELNFCFLINRPSFYFFSFKVTYQK